MAASNTDSIISSGAPKVSGEAIKFYIFSIALNHKFSGLGNF